MPRALTKKEVQDYLRRNGCELISDYVNNKTKISIRCRCGHNRKSQLDHIKTWEQFDCKDCTASNKVIKKNPYFKSHRDAIHPMTFSRLKKQFADKYEKTLKYRDDFIPENYNQIITCRDCGLIKNRRNFPYRKGLSFNKDKQCKNCSRKQTQKLRNRHTQEQITHLMVESCKKNSQKRCNRGRTECGDFDIDTQFIIDLSEKQNNMCVYSGRVLDWKTNSKNKASIDRINSEKGYTKDNVQIVCQLVNQAKSNMTHDEFITFIIELYNKKPQNIVNETGNTPDIKTIKRLLKISKSSAIKRNKSGRTDAGVHAITVEDVIDISYKQDNRCIYSGYNLWNSTEKASIDRINSNLGYIKSNIQLITFRSNQAKSDLSEEEFMRLVIDIHNNIPIVIRTQTTSDFMKNSNSG